MRALLNWLIAASLLLFPTRPLALLLDGAEWGRDSLAAVARVAASALQ
jgi:hypothetical protein